MGSLNGGIYTPLVTPFDNDEIDLSALAGNVAKLNSENLQGYVLLGSTGEAKLLDGQEQFMVIETVAAAADRNDKKIIIGVMEESAKHAVSFMKKAAEFEPDAFLVLPPNYYKPFIDGKLLYRFYADLKEAIDRPILYYNIPLFSSISIETADILSFSNDGLIAGWKDSSDEIERFGEVSSRSTDRFLNFTGNAKLLLSALQKGADGAILAVSNALPGLCGEIFKHFMDGENTKSERAQSKLDGIIDKVIQPFGIAGLKTMMNLLGYAGGSMRNPFSSLTDAQTEQVRQFLDSNGFIS
ncbi:MAG: dihydrodipicolinate synthase family protein [Candidatus Marinimicrobia bacterium]|nr:dihydrodipicolinate synthase family protein [Candidatus Neomarinimicrobiota bacterium]